MSESDRTYTPPNLTLNLRTGEVSIATHGDLSEKAHDLLSKFVADLIAAGSTAPEDARKEMFDNIKEHVFSDRSSKRNIVWQIPGASLNALRNTPPSCSIEGMQELAKSLG